MKKISSFVVIFLVAFSTFSMIKNVAASGQLQLTWWHIDYVEMLDLPPPGIFGDELIIEILGDLRTVNVTMRVASAGSILNMTGILQNFGDEAIWFEAPNIAFTVTPSEYKSYVTHEIYFYKGRIEYGDPGQPGNIEPPIIMNPNENVTVKEHLEVSQDCLELVTVNLLLHFISTTVNQPPVADFRYRGPKNSFTPSTIYVGSEVKFDAEASCDSDGTIISYTWNFGDGSPLLTETDEVAYHTYLTSGLYTVTLTVADEKGATGEISKDIFINSLKSEIYFEIDYMTGHEPTDSVLEYIHSYFRDNGIYVYFFVDDEISPADPSVTENEFWQYEATYNDVVLFNDQAQDGIDTDADTRDGEYFLKEKWILYGTVWADDDLLGSTYSLIERRDHPDWVADVVAGNYLFIADQACDAYAQELTSYDVIPEEVETVVLMHEIGHSIGIGEDYWRWIEDEQREEWIEHYDPTEWSVMAKAGPKNCNADPIRYSHRYWNLKDMEYYTI